MYNTKVYFSMASNVEDGWCAVCKSLELPPSWTCKGGAVQVNKEQAGHITFLGSPHLAAGLHIGFNHGGVTNGI